MDGSSQENIDRQITVAMLCDRQKEQSSKSLFYIFDFSDILDSLIFLEILRSLFVSCFADSPQ